VPTEASFLAQIKLFAQLDDDERGVLAQVVTERRVNTGEVLFKAGEPGDSMFIVKDGAIELSVKDTAGQKIILHTARTGDFFGELSLLDGGSRTASAIAEAPTDLVVLDREDLLQLFRKRPEAALDMLAAMGGMTRKANAMLRERVVRNVNEQVAEERGNVVLRVADWVAAFSGSITFLVLHVGIFGVWILLNIGLFSFGGFDPFPFGLLTMAVSLEAIILSTLLLFSSNRQTERDRVRGDIEYEINLKAELEVAHLHEKTDRIYEDMLDRFAKIEKALGIAPRLSGQMKTAAASDPALPKADAKTT
jgi:CRP/FNR family cyclic AMP-dependent transcriptional regulator